MQGHESERSIDPGVPVIFSCLTFIDIIQKARAVADTADPMMRRPVTEIWRLFEQLWGLYRNSLFLSCPLWMLIFVCLDNKGESSIKVIRGSSSLKSSVSVFKNRCKDSKCLCKSVTLLKIYHNTMSKFTESKQSYLPVHKHKQFLLFTPTSSKIRR